jgi:hypothetical protein
MKRRGISFSVVKVLQLALIFACLSLRMPGQANQGELQIRVTDPGGAGLSAIVHITSQANQYSRSLSTDKEGALAIQHLPFGLYRIEVERGGFAHLTSTVEIRSAIPVKEKLAMSISTQQQSIVVGDTLLDRDQPGSVDQLDKSEIQDRIATVPGRSIQDLVITQPGWLYEGNAVLHPRGSEYQTQFVIDGIPITDNRSPSFGPELEADDVQSLSVYTAGIPAEYGRKMGGVVEVNTQQDTQPGWHGETSLRGGSFGSVGGFAKVQYGSGKDTYAASADGSRTDRYLNPVIPQNYFNSGTLGNFSATYRRGITQNDKLSVGIRHELSRYDIPNELIQQAAGQRQTGDNVETMAIASYQHLFSAHAMAQISGMVREDSDNFRSNRESIPVYVAQRNSFRDGYFKGVVTSSRGIHEWKAGVESDNTFLHEDTCYLDTAGVTGSTGDARLHVQRGLNAVGRENSDAAVEAATDPALCTGAPAMVGNKAPFSYVNSRPELDQAGFIEDLIHLKEWTISAGARLDHYQLILNEWSLEPRFSIARYISQASSVLHFSYDRVFQTPSSQNILLSSSTQVESIDPTHFLRLPIKPSVGDYYEVGTSSVLAQHLKLDANWFRRVVHDFADDDQIESTSISFPIAFRKAIIYGLEGKIEVPEWNKGSGFASYSYQVGNVWNPVTGGLFLGNNAQEAAADLSGHFPATQDQRNTVRGRVRYQMHPRLWVGVGVRYDSGLPFEFGGDRNQALAQYGAEMVDRVNFARGRIDPVLQLSASAGADLYHSDRIKVRMQADGQNLTDVLDVVNFGGLFSGNSIGPSRSSFARLTTTF